MAHTHNGNLIVTENLTVGTQGGVINGEVKHIEDASAGTVQAELQMLKENSNFRGISEHFHNLPSTSNNNDLYFCTNSVDIPLKGAASGKGYLSQGLNANTLLYLNGDIIASSENYTFDDNSQTDRRFFSKSSAGSEFSKFGEAYIDFKSYATGGTNDNGKLFEKAPTGDFKDLTEGTISMWIRPVELPSHRNEDYIICGFSKSEFYIKWDKIDDTFKVYSREGSVLQPINSENSFKPFPVDRLHDWHNILFTWNTDKWEMYLDGQHWGEWSVSNIVTYASTPTKPISFGNIPMNGKDNEGIDFPVDEIIIEPTHLTKEGVLDYYSDGEEGGFKPSGWYRYENGSWINFRAINPHIVTSDGVSYQGDTLKNILDTFFNSGVGVFKGYVRDYDELPSDTGVGGVFLVGEHNTNEIGRKGWTPRADVYAQLQTIDGIASTGNYQTITSDIDMLISHESIHENTDSDGFLGTATIAGDVRIKPINVDADFIANRKSGTVMFWMKGDDVVETDTIFRFEHSTGATYTRETEFSLYVDVESNGDRRFKLRLAREENFTPIDVPNTYAPVLDSTNFFDDSFHHVAIIWDHSGWRIILDGSPYYTFSNTSDLIPMSVHTSNATIKDQPDLLFRRGSNSFEYKEIIISQDAYADGYVSNYYSYTPSEDIKKSGFYRKDIGGFTRLAVEDPFSVLDNISVDLIPSNTSIDIGNSTFPFSTAHISNLNTSSIQAENSQIDRITSNDIFVDSIIPVAMSGSTIGSISSPYSEMFADVLFVDNVILSGGSSIQSSLNDITADINETSVELLEIINSNINNIESLTMLMESLEASQSNTETTTTSLSAAHDVLAHRTLTLEVSAASMLDSIKYIQVRNIEKDEIINENSLRIVDLENNNNLVQTLSVAVDAMQDQITTIDQEVDSQLLTAMESLSGQKELLDINTIDIDKNTVNIVENSRDVSQLATDVNQQNINIIRIQNDLDLLIAEGIPSGSASTDYVDAKDDIIQVQISELITNVADLSSNSGSSNAEDDILGDASQGAYDGPSNILPTDKDNEAIYKLDHLMQYLLPPKPSLFPDGNDIIVSGTSYTATLASNADVPGIGNNGTIQTWYESPQVAFNAPYMGEADKGRYVLEVLSDPISGYVEEDVADLQANFNEDFRDNELGQPIDTLVATPLGRLECRERKWYSSNEGVIPYFPLYQTTDVFLSLNTLSGVFGNEQTNKLKIYHDFEYDMGTARESNLLEFKYWSGWDSGQAPIITESGGSFNTPVIKTMSGVSYFTSTSTFNLSASMSRYSNNVYQPDMMTVSSSVGFGGDSLNRGDFGLTAPSAIDETSSMNQVYSITSANSRFKGDYIVNLTPLAYSRDGSIVPVNLGSVILDTYDDTNDNASNRNFSDEQYRLKSGDYDLYSDIASNSWDTTETVGTGANTGYENALVVSEGELVSRNYDFSQHQPHGLNSIVNPDLTGLFSNGDAYYTYFEDTTSHSSGSFTIGGELASGLGTKFKIFMKLPSLTGWMDLETSYSGSGSAASSGPRLSASGNVINWTLGTASTSSSNNAIVVRIEYHDTTTSFSSFSVTWN